MIHAFILRTAKLVLCHSLREMRSAVTHDHEDIEAACGDYGRPFVRCTIMSFKKEMCLFLI